MQCSYMYRQYYEYNGFIIIVVSVNFVDRSSSGLDTW